MSRAASNAGYFRAWPDAQVGTAVYESGVCVAPDAHKSGKATRAAHLLLLHLSGVALLSRLLQNRCPNLLLRPLRSPLLKLPTLAVIR